MPRPRRMALRRGAALDELVEDALVQFRGDADAAVDDVDAHGVAAPARADDDAAARV